MERLYEDDRMVIIAWPDKPRVAIRKLASPDLNGPWARRMACEIGAVLERFGPKLELIVDYSLLKEFKPNAELRAWAASVVEALRLFGLTRYVRVVPAHLAAVNERHGAAITPSGMDVTVVTSLDDAHAVFDEDRVEACFRRAAPSS